MNRWKDVFSSNARRPGFYPQAERESFSHLHDSTTPALNEVFFGMRRGRQWSLDLHQPRLFKRAPIRN
jgi:hypothetical protein